MIAGVRCRLVTLVMMFGTLLLSIAHSSGLGADLKDLLSGESTPLSLELRDLGSDWRRFTIHTIGTASSNISVSVTGSGGSSASSQNNVADITGSRSYYTRGLTESVGDRSYLVAYRQPGNSLDLTGLIQALATKQPPAPAVLKPETTLSLCLLDLESLGSLEDIRAFDLEGEIAESERLAKTIATVLSAAGGADKKATEPPAPSSQEK